MCSEGFLLAQDFFGGLVAGAVEPTIELELDLLATPIVGGLPPVAAERRHEGGVGGDAGAAHPRSVEIPTELPVGVCPPTEVGGLGQVRLQELVDELLPGRLVGGLGVAGGLSSLLVGGLGRLPGDDIHAAVQTAPQAEGGPDSAVDQELALPNGAPDLKPAVHEEDAPGLVGQTVLHPLVGR